MARHLDKATRHRLLRRAAIWGIVAGGCLVLLYVAVLGLASSLAHASEELRRLWPWTAALVGGFALQVGLFTYVRGAMRGSGAAHMHGVAASGAATTLSMVACCAHHLADVLPLLGLARCDRRRGRTCGR